MLNTLEIFFDYHSLQLFHSLPQNAIHFSNQSCWLKYWLRSIKFNKFSWYCFIFQCFPCESIEPLFGLDIPHFPSIRICSSSSFINEMVQINTTFIKFISLIIANPDIFIIRLLHEFKQSLDIDHSLRPIKLTKFIYSKNFMLDFSDFIQFPFNLILSESVPPNLLLTSSQSLDYSRRDQSFGFLVISICKYTYLILSCLVTAGMYPRYYL